MIDKIFNWAKRLPWWLSWLFLLILTPIIFFWMLKAQGKGKELAETKHKKDVLEEGLAHAEQFKRLDLTKEKLREVEAKEEELSRKKTETDNLMTVLEADQKAYRERINGVTSWDELG